MIRQTLTQAAYGAAQLARVGWYTAQYVGTRHLAGPFAPPGEVPRPFAAPRPGPRVVQRALFRLLEDEARDVANGVYHMPRELRRPDNPLHLLRQTRLYREETRQVARRAMRSGGGTEAREISDETYPTYYRQNFHYQSDGWFSSRSAEIYDTQVETLFTGAGSAMRRRALPMIAQERARLGRPLRLVDIGCGTARLLSDIVDNWPETAATGIDLSPAYLDFARRSLGHQEAVSFVQAAAEGLPFADASQDIVLSVYLFHELPPKVRPRVAGEIARVLRPGGLYVHVDSVQYGDTDMDLLLESFPRAVHEPYYDSYCREDLSALFGGCGLPCEEETVGFLTKASGFRRAG